MKKTELNKLIDLLTKGMEKASKETCSFENSDNPQIKELQASAEARFWILEEVRDYLLGNKTSLKITCN